MKKKPIKKVRAIIYDIEKNKAYFLILHRILRWEGWEALKETIEKGESPKDALERGIHEETSLKKFKIIKSLHVKEKWEVGGNNYLIIDTFLVRADKKQGISLKQEIVEHDKYAWVDKKTAIQKLTWPETKKLFEKLEINAKSK
jgi:ADP-ribose pyrophosphatase YjhB (NUDIX family)